MPRHLQGSVPRYSGKNCPFNAYFELNRISSVKWAKGQDGILLLTPERVKMDFCYLPPERVKTGCCCLPPDRVKLTMNSKKQTNSRVKMSQGSRWASVITP